MSMPDQNDQNGIAPTTPVAPARQPVPLGKQVYRDGAWEVELTAQARLVEEPKPPPPPAAPRPPEVALAGKSQRTKRGAAWSWSKTVGGYGSLAGWAVYLILLATGVVGRAEVVPMPAPARVEINHSRLVLEQWRAGPVSARLREGERRQADEAIKKDLPGGPR